MPTLPVPGTVSALKASAFVAKVGGAQTVTNLTTKLDSVCQTVLDMETLTWTLRNVFAKDSGLVETAQKVNKNILVFHSFFYLGQFSSTRGRFHKKI